MPSANLHNNDNVCNFDTEHNNKPAQLVSRPQEDSRSQTGGQTSAVMSDDDKTCEETHETVGEYLKQAEFHMQQGDSKAGKLLDCVDTWKDFTSDPHILKITRGFGVEFIEKPQQGKIQGEYNFSASEIQFIEQELD